MNQIRAVIYTRVSSEEQAKEGFSLQAQREKIETYVKTSVDLTLASVYFYTDEGISGATKIEERPGLTSLFEAAKRNEFDIVLVYKVDRFFRDLKFLLQAVDELAKYKVEFRSITEPFDISAMGRFMLSTFGGAAELERANIMQRMELGKDRAHVRVFGWAEECLSEYKLNRETKRLEVNEGEAEVVKTLFGMFINERLSVHGVTDRINTMQIPTRLDRLGKAKPSGTKNFWRIRTISRILGNPIYVGEFVYKRKKFPARSDYPTNFNDEKNPIIQNVPRLIEPEILG
jgi:site-specific DNA recombinase